MKGKIIKIINILLFISLILFILVRVFIIFLNNKRIDQSLFNTIKENERIVTLGAGLYNDNNSYIYKGFVNNNYVMFNNFLWRIVRINSSGSIEIISDDYFNVLTREKNEFLTNVLLPNLDKEFLAQYQVCEGNYPDCSNIKDYYINYLSINDFADSFYEEDSYIINADDSFWLYEHDDDGYYYASGNSIKKGAINSFNKIRPVILLKPNVSFIKGDGTKDNPFLINDEFSIGSILEIDGDSWVVYDTRDNILLASLDLIDNELEFGDSYDINDKNGIGYYLNHQYLKNKDYKEYILENEWYINGNKLKAKVGIPAINDIKINSNEDSYFLLDKIGKYQMAYGQNIIFGEGTTIRKIRPCIKLNNSIKDKIKKVDGKYILEK